MFLGNIIDQFLDENGLTYSGTAEQTDLSSFKVRLEQVYHLDSCKKNLLRRCQILKLRWLSMNRECSFPVESLHTVNRTAGNIHYPASDLRTYRHCYRTACTFCCHSTLKSVCTVHSNCTHSIFSDVLLHFDNQFLTVGTADKKGFMNRRELPLI